jgi:integrase
MRPDEVMSLEQADVDIAKRSILIRSGKTRSARRTLRMHSESVSILARRIDGGKWVFPGKRHETHVSRLNGSHHKILKETGVGFVLYDLRHSFATRMAETGCDLSTLAAILGHSSVRMVQRYVHITQSHQDEAMRRYELFMDRPIQQVQRRIGLSREVLQ